MSFLGRDAGRADQHGRSGIDDPVSDPGAGSAASTGRGHGFGLWGYNKYGWSSHAPVSGDCGHEVDRYLAFGSVPDATLGFLLISRMRHYGYDVDLYLRRALGGVLVTVAVLMLVRTLYGRFPEPRPDFLKQYRRPVTIAWGAMVGFAVGLTSVGNGSLVAPGAGRGGCCPTC